MEAPAGGLPPSVSTILPQPVEEIWQEYHQGRNVHLLDLLILAYVPLDTNSLKFNLSAVSEHGDTTRSALSFHLLSEAPEALEAAAHPLNQWLPARITIKQDFAAVRTAPGQAYTLFPPQGTIALADSYAYGSYRLRLTNGRRAWIEDKFVSLDTTRRDLPAVSVGKIAVHAGDSWTALEIPLTQPVMFDLAEADQGGREQIPHERAVAPAMYQQECRRAGVVRLRPVDPRLQAALDDGPRRRPGPAATRTRARRRGARPGAWRGSCT